MTSETLVLNKIPIQTIIYLLIASIIFAMTLSTLTSAMSPNKIPVLKGSYNNTIATFNVPLITYSEYKSDKAEVNTETKTSGTSTTSSTSIAYYINKYAPAVLMVLLICLIMIPIVLTPCAITFGVSSVLLHKWTNKSLV